MLDNPLEWDSETINLTRGFLTCLCDFKFNFLLQIYSEIFPFSDMLFESLQKKNIDINLSNNKVKNYQKIISHFRDKFQHVWEKTNEIIKIDETCNTRVKIDFVHDIKTSYRKLFYEIIDNISSELNTRFKNIMELTFLELLNSNCFSTFKHNFPEQQFKKLQEYYGKYFDFPKLRSELTVVYSDEDFLDKPISEIFDFLQCNELVTSFTEVTNLCKLYLTIPTTSASSERSFSALRRIKNYLRSTISDERLSHVSLISIEKNLLSQMKELPNFYTLIINEFKKTNRRIELNFK